jgi:hypothetical protein
MEFVATELVIATGFGCGSRVKGAMGTIEFVIVTGFGSGSANCATTLAFMVIRGGDKGVDHRSRSSDLHKYIKYRHPTS